jgi:hypothetical protein
MKNGESANAGAQIPGIVGEFLQGLGGRFHQQAVEDLGVRTG